MCQQWEVRYHFGLVHGLIWLSCRVHCLIWHFRFVCDIVMIINNHPHPHPNSNPRLHPNSLSLIVLFCRCIPFITSMVWCSKINVSDYANQCQKGVWLIIDVQRVLHESVCFLPLLCVCSCLTVSAYCLIKPPLTNQETLNTPVPSANQINISNHSDKCVNDTYFHCRVSLLTRESYIFLPCVTFLI